MMGSRANPGKFDCHAAAEDDEPTFTLLARDPHAPDLVEMWARRRLIDIAAGTRPAEDNEKVKEALGCAWDMRVWREKRRG